MLYFIPIERLEERYTAQMYLWVLKELGARQIPHTIILGEEILPVRTEAHQFLAWAPTIAYKASQLVEIARAFHEGTIKDGDIFFIADIWFPGIEAIRYLAQMLSISVKIYGINHAGVFDPHDLVRPLLPWGKYLEACWYEMCDGVFVGSEYMKSLMEYGLFLAGIPLKHNIYATGLVWDEKEMLKLVEPYYGERPVVIWPHRLSPEKNVRQFYEIVDRIAPSFPEVRWIISSSRTGQQYQPENEHVEFVTQPKAQYYGMLEASKLMLSTAHQENFGYTVLEATALNVPILCPCRANYPEMILSGENLYEDTNEAVTKIVLALADRLPVARLKPFGGFSEMLDIMGY